MASGVSGMQPQAAEENSAEDARRSANHTLLQYHDPDVRLRGCTGKPGWRSSASPNLHPAGTLIFSGYEQIIPPRSPATRRARAQPARQDLVRLGRAGQCPSSRAPTRRAPNFAIVAKSAEAPEVADFVPWLKSEAS